MPRDISNTPEQEKCLALINKTMPNPDVRLFDTLFAAHLKSPPAYKTDDIIEIGPNESPFVKSKSKTTIGIYIINKFLVEDFQVFGYINKEFNKKMWESFESAIGKALMAGDITLDMVFEYINRSQYLCGGPLAQIINPSLSENILTLPPSAKKMKDTLIKENEEAIKNNDPNSLAQVERKVVDEAMAKLKVSNDPSSNLFDSGIIDPHNNYKVMFVMKGAIKDNTGESPTGYKIATSNYADGITKDDLPIIGDALVSSAYARGVSTQNSGAKSKQYDTVFQHIRVAKKGSDCHTKLTMKTEIKPAHLYRYIMVSNKPVLLDDDTLPKYLGKVCDLRTPIHCHQPEPEYCNICVGERPYIIGIHNTGLTISMMSGATLNASMKVMHDSTIKLHEVKVEDFLKFVK